MRVTRPVDCGLSVVLRNQADTEDLYAPQAAVLGEAGTRILPDA